MMRLTWRNKIPREMLMDNERRREIETIYCQLENVLENGPKNISLDPLLENQDCHEVFPNIFLGSGTVARNKLFLKRIGITHVVNAAMGPTQGYVDTNSDFYKDISINFIGFRMLDLPIIDISRFFHDAAEFVDGALRAGGKVFVHCVMGISRSSTLVCAFLMMKRAMSATEALKLLRKHRFVQPNYGFLNQLAELDVQLREKRDELEKRQREILMWTNTSGSNNPEYVSSGPSTRSYLDRNTFLRSYPFLPRNDHTSNENSERRDEPDNPPRVRLNRFTRSLPADDRLRSMNLPSRGGQTGISVHRDPADCFERSRNSHLGRTTFRRYALPNPLLREDLTNRRWNNALLPTSYLASLNQQYHE